jgi:hypothetical protein
MNKSVYVQTELGWMTDEMKIYIEEVIVIL